MPQPIFDQKNILVTGGAGFIGSFLCEELVKGAKVICVDNFVSGSQANIDHLFRLPNFIFLKHNLREPLDLTAFPELERFQISLQGVQEIYHLACPTSPKEFDKYRIETLEANSIVMKHVLDLALQYKAKFVNASSSVVYGPRPAENAFFIENYLGAVDFLSPRACYDEGKRFTETMTATYRQVHGLDAKSARIFRTYGPRMRLFDGQMIPDFITNALDGNDLVIYGDETFYTSLVYVTDVAEGLIKLMDAPADIGAVNIGSDQDLKLAEVARMIVELTNSSSKIVFEEPLLFMTPLGLPDLTKVKERLGWIPIVTLGQGLQKTIEYTMANKGILGAQTA
ncbi:NAD-dependent epimerase/dehydratase family protein [Candidatus Uhrbacteria bacterium]|nr:NAD-dependent epimerase/dehydratase family protein [Candidatus Uhrbacteria bacterium]